MNSKEVVWIVGTSASGKETFARRVSHDTSLASQLGWEGERIAAAENSLQHLAQSPTDPVTWKRERIFEEVPALLTDHDVVLLKWQFVDSETDRPVRLREQLPDARHSVIVLHAPEEELRERLPRKAWWNEWGSERFMQNELRLTEEASEWFSQRFPVRHLYSGANGGYRQFAPNGQPLTVS